MFNKPEHLWQAHTLLTDPDMFATKPNISNKPNMFNKPKHGPQNPKTNTNLLTNPNIVSQHQTFFNNAPHIFQKSDTQRTTYFAKSDTHRTTHFSEIRHATHQRCVKNQTRNAPNIFPKPDI